MKFYFHYTMSDSPGLTSAASRRCQGGVRAVPRADEGLGFFPSKINRVLPLPRVQRDRTRYRARHQENGERGDEHANHPSKANGLLLGTLVAPLQRLTLTLLHDARSGYAWGSSPSSGTRLATGWRVSSSGRRSSRCLLLQHHHSCCTITIIDNYYVVQALLYIYITSRFADHNNNNNNQQCNFRNSVGSRQTRDNRKTET